MTLCDSLKDALDFLDDESLETLLDGQHRDQKVTLNKSHGNLENLLSVIEIK